MTQTRTGDPSLRDSIDRETERYKHRGEDTTAMIAKMHPAGTGYLPGVDPGGTHGNANAESVVHATQNYIGVLPDGRAIFATKIDASQLPSSMFKEDGVTLIHPNEWISGRTVLVSVMGAAGGDDAGKWMRFNWTPMGVVNALEQGLRF